MKAKHKIVIFQAPWASLRDCGILQELRTTGRYNKPIPAEYYAPVYSGEVEQDISERAADPAALLSEKFLYIFSGDSRPNPQSSRPLSVGDVVQVDGWHYLVVADGLLETRFIDTHREDPVIPKPEAKGDVAPYLEAKYGICGKAASLLENILGFYVCQYWDGEDSDDFLEQIFQGLGISARDRSLVADILLKDPDED